MLKLTLDNEVVKSRRSAPNDVHCTSLRSFFGDVFCSRDLFQNPKKALIGANSHQMLSPTEIPDSYSGLETGLVLEFRKADLRSTLIGGYFFTKLHQPKRDSLVNSHTT